MTNPVELPIDQDARDIAINDIDHSTFISAGAGGGKSTTIVDRLVNALLVDERNLELENIAAITFTERAGAELAQKVREKLVEELAENPSEKLKRALDSLDSATIGTIHSFALDILTRFPVQAGLPLEFKILDDTSSKRMVQDLSREVLDNFIKTYVPNDEAAAFKRDLTVSHLQTLVSAVFSMQHRLADDFFGEVVFENPEVEIRKIGLVLEKLKASPDFDPRVLTPGYFAKVNEGFESFSALLEAGDFSLPSLAAFHSAVLKVHSGKANSSKNDVFWQQVQDCKVDLDVFSRLLNVDNELLARELLFFAWKFVKNNQSSRIAAGNISFDDLLFLAVRTLREHKDVREAIYSQYKLLIIDEFQDTDPMQWELALLVTTHPEKDIADPEPGSLVLVGDAQQSIYSFRGADLSTFEQAREQFSTNFQKTKSLTLQVNFRSTDGILNWVNACFAPLGLGAEFAPLSPAAGNTVGSKFGPAVHVLRGDQGSVLGSKDEPRAIASAIKMAVESKWQVRDGKHAIDGSRDVRYEDIALLIPTRSSFLDKLLTSLEDLQVPYRSNDARIVYDRPAVIGLLAALRVISGYGVPLDLWVALKSPLFGCTDTDLLVYKKAGGKWKLPSKTSFSQSPGTVENALQVLATIRDTHKSAQPSQVFTGLVMSCNLAATYHQVLRGEFELDCVDMVIQHARKWERAGGAGLIDYSNWIRDTLEDSSRERLPEMDDQDDSAVRISTIHAVKGLEFPMVVLAGLGVDRQVDPPTLAVNEDNQIEFYLSGTNMLMSAGYQRDLLDLQKERITQEHLRVLYVAATRAKDHLVVSGARKLNQGGASENDWGHLIWESVEATVAANLATSHSQLLPPAKSSWAEIARVEPVADAWLETVEEIRKASKKKFVQSPSDTSGSAETYAVSAVTLIDDDQPSHDSIDYEPEIAAQDVKRLGTEFHEIMEKVVKYRIDLQAGRLNEEVDKAVRKIDLPEHAPRLTAMLNNAIASDFMQRAFVAPKVWPELSMFASDGTYDGVITEGFADLVFQDGLGLVVLDYKTNLDLTPEKIEKYKGQLGSYADLIERSTGLKVSEQVLLHVTSTNCQAHIL